MAETLRLKPGALEWREIDGEVVVLDTRASKYLAVRGSGTVLWPALMAGATREELVSSLVSRFDVDAATAGSDVDAFVRALRDQDLLDAAAVAG